MKKKRIYIRPAITVIRSTGEKHILAGTYHNYDHGDSKHDYFAPEEEEDDGWEYKKYNIWEDQ